MTDDSAPKKTAQKAAAPTKKKPAVAKKPAATKKEASVSASKAKKSTHASSDASSKAKSAAKPSDKKVAATQTKTRKKSSTAGVNKSNCYYGTGRRKTSVARVYIKPNGSGKITVNKHTLDEYFGADSAWQMIVRQPCRLLGVEKQFDISATVKGGGIAGQAGALRHAIARALIAYDEATGGSQSAKTALSSMQESLDKGEEINVSGLIAGEELSATTPASPPSYRRLLRAKGFVTRDSRRKERKKVGLHGARRAPQYSKR